MNLSKEDTILFCFYTHNRPKILQACLATAFNNTEIKPTEAIISDDGSTPELKRGLFNFCLENTRDFPINFMSFNKNIMYGNHAEFMLNYIKWRDCKYVAVIETDYILRKDWLKDALAALRARPKAIGVSLYSNPDYYDKRKTEEMFPRIIKEDFGTDLLAPYRENYHRPHFIDTEIGQIEIQYTTNCCGSYILNWQNISNMIKLHPEIQQTVFDRSCNKHLGGDRRYFGDGPFTHGLSYYWGICLLELDYSQNYHFIKNEGPWIDICDYSIGQHVNGEGINGGIVSEGSTFVGSPKWKDEFLEKNPRKTS